MWNRNSLFLVLLILFSCLHAAFEKEVLDSNKLSRYPSLGVGPDGMPQVIYGGGSFGLTYKYWDGTSWVSEPIGDQERATMVTSLAVDSKNFPHICYSPFGFYAEYLFWDGGSWGTQVVDPEGKKVSLCSIALDSNDVPHIAYVFGIHDTLKYAALSGGTWKIQEVDSDIDAPYISFAVDNKGLPGIIYFNRSQLQYAHYDGTAWAREQIEDECIDDLPSLAFDSKGLPGIVYHHCHSAMNYTGNALKYTHFDGASWNTQIVSEREEQGRMSILRFDSSDYPHIFYQNEDDGTVDYASWDGEKWNIEVVDSYEFLQAIEFALDSKGNPNFVYIDEGLKYATREKPTAPAGTVAPRPSENQQPSASSEGLGEEAGGGGLCGPAFMLTALLGAFFLRRT